MPRTVITTSGATETNNWIQKAEITVTIEGDQEHHVKDARKALDRAYSQAKDLLERYGRDK